MSIPDQILPPHWQYYADRANEAQFGRADEYGLGREEQLGETLATIERAEPFDDVCRARLDRIPQNRAKKHRRLRQQVARGTLEKATSPDPFEQCATNDMAARIRALLTAEQLEVEYRLATDGTYILLAREYEVSPGALKVKVCRWRATVRKVMNRS